MAGAVNFAMLLGVISSISQGCVATTAMDVHQRREFTAAWASQPVGGPPRRAVVWEAPRAAAAPPARSTAPVAPSEAAAPGLAAPELLAGARRLLGVSRGVEGDGFLRHLLVIAALPGAPRPGEEAAPGLTARVAQDLEARGRSLEADAVGPGDLVFLGEGTPTHAAIVEEKVHSEITCIGSFEGSVRRFSLAEIAEAHAFARP